MPTALLLTAVFFCVDFVALVLSWTLAYLYQHFHLTLAKAAVIATVCPDGDRLMAKHRGEASPSR